MAGGAVIAWLKRALGTLRPCAGDWWESEIEYACRDGRPWGMRHFPQQPVNAWSNVAYPVAGLATALVLRTPESLVFALAMLALGIGSFLYHAWPSVKSAKLDHAGMYAVFLSLVTFNVGGPWWAMAVASGVGAYAFRYAFSMDLNAMMGLFLWISLVATGLSPTAVASLVYFVLAMVAWQLDRRRLLTHRWGHGLWHVLTAAAIALMFGA